MEVAKEMAVSPTVSLLVVEDASDFNIKKAVKSSFN